LCCVVLAKLPAQKNLSRIIERNQFEDNTNNANESNNKRGLTHYPNEAFCKL
jgi:hypothetical protein